LGESNFKESTSCIYKTDCSHGVLADAVPLGTPILFASHPFPHFIYVPNFMFHLRIQAGERFYACRHFFI